MLTKYKHLLLNKLSNKKSPHLFVSQPATGELPDNVVTSLTELPFEIEKILFLDEHEQIGMSIDDIDNFLFIKSKKHSDRNKAYILQSAQANPDSLQALCQYKYEIIQKTEYKYTKTHIVSPNVIRRVYENYNKHSSLSQSDLVNYFDGILTSAINQNASDIHIKVMQDSADVSFRVHGEIIHHSRHDAEHMHKMILSVYNGQGAEGQKDQQFDLGEKQQTIIERHINNRMYRIRFMSSKIVAESNDDLHKRYYIVALRLLSSDASAIKNIHDLGYTEMQLESLRRVSLAPSGGIIFSGTTGSGKSTSLAGLIIEILSYSKGKKKIISVESPVEYVINGVDQLVVHESAGMSEEEITEEFNKALKALMRLDPDIIYCNEIRNSTTALFSQKAIQSGHLFLSTVHAQSALGVIERLARIEMDLDLLCSIGFIQLVVHQTLIQNSCQYCSKKISDLEITEKNSLKHLIERIEKVVDTYSLPENSLQKIRFRNDSGCNQCNQTGVSGRTVVAEMLLPNIEILKLIREKRTVDAYNAWRNHGFNTILEHAISKLFHGEICPLALESKLGFIDSDINKENLTKQKYKEIYSKLVGSDT
jgi:general secretion pathway protein E